MKRMSRGRIVFVTYDGAHLPTARVRCYRFAEELRRRGFDTEVLSMYDHLGAPYDGALQWKIGDRTKATLIARSLRQLWRERGTLLYLQKAHYHCYGPLVLNRLRRNKLILDYDDWDLAAHPFNTPSHTLPMLTAEALVGQVARRASACVASSAMLRDYLLTFNPTVSLIPTGVDTGRFSWAPPRAAGPLTFSWVGIIWGPEVLAQVRRLLSAYRCVAARRPGATRLVLAGGGELYPEIERDLQRLNDQGCDVQSIGWLDPDRMPAHIASTDVGLVPLDPQSHFSRAKSPTKMFEYMACGRPVIASRVGEAQRILDHGVTGLLATTEDEFVTAMTTLVDNPELRATLGRAARNQIEQHFSLSALGDLLETVVTTVLQSPTNTGPHVTATP